MIIQPHSSISVNVCFNADKEREFRSSVVAALEKDTTTLALVGHGVKQKPSVPVPTKLAINLLKPKRRSERTFAIDLPTRSSVTLEVEDILGKTQRRLLTNEVKTPGVYEVTFNWKDDNQKALPAGTYYVRLQAQNIENHAIDKVSAVLEMKP